VNKLIKKATPLDHSSQYCEPTSTNFEASGNIGAHPKHPNQYEMKASTQSFVFEQIHIEVARNATDDFNLLHDKKKWQCTRHNPFEGPIVPGFQLEALLERQIEVFRSAQDERGIIDRYNLRFSNYKY